MLIVINHVIKALKVHENERQCRTFSNRNVFRLNVFSVKFASKHRDIESMKHFVDLFIFNFLLIGRASSQSNGCDYFKKLKPDRTYTITSPRYPQRYRRETNCRWAVEAPAGYKISLNCYEVTLARSLFCYGDRILASKTGRTDVRDSKRNCETFKLTSTSTKMTVALRTQGFSYGGRFKCSLHLTADSCNCGLHNKARIGLTNIKNVYS